MSNFILYDYQQRAIQSIMTDSDKYNKLVLVMATGTGKTVVFAELATYLIKTTRKKALVLAHREELLTQARTKLLAVEPTLKIGIEKAESVSDHVNDDVVVASVPTLGREGSNRINKFNPKDFCLIVCDEAHHSAAETYKNIFRYFGVLKSEPENNWNRDCVLLGVTATPSRTDNKGINTIYDKISFEYHLIRAVKENYLCRIRAYRILTDIDISSVSTVTGDYHQGELQESIDISERNKLIVRTYQEKVPFSKALAFCVGIEHAENLQREFLTLGIPSACVFGSTPKQEREKIFQDFGTGRIKVLVNVGVATEGLDIPSIQSILLCRPTQSSILFNQMLGRGTRKHSSKQFVTILDFVDTTRKNRPITTASLLGLHQAVNFNGRDILEAKEDIDKIRELSPEANLERIDLTNIKWEEFDFFASLQLPKPLEGLTSLSFFEFRDNYYRLSLPNRGMIHVFQNALGQWDCLDERFVDGQKETASIATVESIEQAFHETEKYFNLHHADKRGLALINAPWKKERPSEKQIYWLRKNGISDEKISNLTKGQASLLMSKLFAH